MPSSLLLEAIDVPLQFQDRATQMKLGRAVKAAVGNRWGGVRGIHPHTFQRVRGFRRVVQPDGQPQPDGTSPKPGWPDGRPDLNPLQPGDLSSVDDLDNLFLERNKEINREAQIGEDGGNLNTGGNLGGDLGCPGCPVAQTPSAAVGFS